MPQCPQCGASQPTDDLVLQHLERFCRLRTVPPVAPAAPLDDLFGPVISTAVPTTTNGHIAIAAPANLADGGIWYPSHDANFILEREQKAKVELVMRLSETSPQNLLLTGPAGTGKTSLPQQMAAKYGRPFALIPFGKLQEVSQIFGERLISNGTTYYQKSLLWQAMETDGCIICGDEINRCENPKVANGMLNLLDNNRQTWVDELQCVLRVAPRVVFVLTMNEGFEYSGIDPLDDGLRSRCRSMEMGFPPRDTSIAVVSQKTGISVEQATTLMNIVCGEGGGGAPMRSLLFAGEFLQAGATYRQAVTSGFSTTDKRQLSAMLRLASDADGITEYVEQWSPW